MYLRTVLCLSEVDEFISKANDKLISSKILFDNQQYATSVSAAYYCMFLTAKALLIKKDYNPKSHEGLISLFGQVYVNQGDFDRKIAKYLARAQSLREDADYDAVDGITESIAKLWIMLKNSGKKLKNFYNINVLIDHTYFNVIVFNSIM